MILSWWYIMYHGDLSWYHHVSISCIMLVYDDIIMVEYHDIIMVVYHISCYYHDGIYHDIIMVTYHGIIL